MQIAYIDESYNDTYYFVGAAVGSESSWAAVAEELEKLRGWAIREYGLREDVEFHGALIMGGKHEWEALRGKHREAADVMAKVLRIAADAGVQYVFRGVHMPGLTQRYMMPDHPHAVVLEHTFQRLENYALKLQLREPVRLVADMIDIRDELQSQFSGYQQLGTRSRWNRSKLDHLAYPIEFRDSRATPGLQVIDVAVYLYRRSCVLVEKHPAAIRTQRRLLKILTSSTLAEGTWYPRGEPGK